MRFHSNMFEFTFDNKRYHTLHFHLLKTFGEKIYKAVIDAGFTCPNIDGKCGYGGCSYCASGSGEFTHGARFSVTEQLKMEFERISKKRDDPKIIPYFQAHTNTYASVEVLRRKYTEAISFPNTVGLSVATRPDCIDEKIADMLKEFSDKTYLTVELGLQTIHDKTARAFNRGYDYEVFLESYRLLKERNIRVCLHIINGLKDETKEDMLETAITIGKMRPEAVKIHLLHVIKGTVYAELYKKGDIIPMSKPEYIDVVCNQLEHLPPETVIERITGDGNKETLLAPIWSCDKISVLGGIDKELSLRNSYQGIKYSAE
ncbi:MAG: TIGR01212 family radical SAM protein [Ruminococcaceae bacterium]|nr:TIGR01212 family radical SAM protein [Oscillospiraceae bacterium]